MTNFFTLQEQETVKSVIHKPLRGLWLTLLIGGLILSFPFFVLFILFAWGKFGIIVLCGFELMGLFIVIRGFYWWDRQRLIVTNLRVIHFDKCAQDKNDAYEVPISSIADLSKEIADWKAQK